MNFTREQTSRVEQGRDLDFWRLLNVTFPENDECLNSAYELLDDEYQKLEDEIETATEVTGIDAGGEPCILVPYTNRKPKGTRPTYPI